MSDTILIKHEASNLYFVDSAKIKVFPCAYRGYKEEADQTHIIFDPESRLNTEKNLIKPTGKLGCEDSYIVKATDTSLHMNFHGYDIVIDAISASDLIIKKPDNSTITLIPTIQLKLLSLDVTAQSAQTKVLASWLGEECLDFPYQLSTPQTDYSGYIFTGLAFCAAVPVLANDNETVSLPEFVIKDTDSGTSWIYNNKYFLPNIKLNQAGETVISDSNFIINHGDVTVTDGSLSVKSTDKAPVFSVDLATKQTTVANVAAGQATLGTDSGNVVLNGQLVANKQAEFNSTVKIGQDAVSVTTEGFDVNLPMSVDKEFVLGDDSQDLLFSIDAGNRAVIVGDPDQDAVFSVDADSKEVTISNGTTLTVHGDGTFESLVAENSLTVGNKIFETNDTGTYIFNNTTITDKLTIDGGDETQTEISGGSIGTESISAISAKIGNGDNLQKNVIINSQNGNYPMVSITSNGTDKTALKVFGSASLCTVGGSEPKEKISINPDATTNQPIVTVSGQTLIKSDQETGAAATTVAIHSNNDKERIVIAADANNGDRGMTLLTLRDANGDTKIAVRPDCLPGISSNCMLEVNGCTKTAALYIGDNTPEVGNRLSTIESRLSSLGFNSGDITNMSTSYISGGKFYKMGKMFCGYINLTGSVPSSTSATTVTLCNMPSWVSITSNINCTYGIVQSVHGVSYVTSITITLKTDKTIELSYNGGTVTTSNTPTIVAAWYFDANNTQHLCFIASSGADVDSVNKSTNGLPTR